MPTPHDPLDSPEDAVRLTHKIFARKANKILNDPALDFDTEKRTQLQTLCGTLTQIIGTIKKIDFPHAAPEPAADDPGSNRAIDAIKCYKDYLGCTNTPENCENAYWDCISRC